MKNLYFKEDEEEPSNDQDEGKEHEDESVHRHDQQLGDYSQVDSSDYCSSSGNHSAKVFPLPVAVPQ